MEDAVAAAGNPIPSLAWPPEPMDTGEDESMLGLGGSNSKDKASHLK